MALSDVQIVGSLDAAWARVEAALPERWEFEGVRRDWGRRNRWMANANHLGALVMATGRTPVAALDALATELEKRP